MNSPGAPDERRGIPKQFEVRRLLGQGSTGTVYEVQDKRTGETLALKKLRRLDASSIDRFKREFRLLKESPHPRVVRLGELYFEQDIWSFTMERIEGVPYSAWVARLPQAPRIDDTDPTHETESTEDPDQTESSQKSLRQAPTFSPTNDSPDRLPFIEERLRSALRQLAEGLLALHDRGIIHCDIKPGNVLIDRSGQLFIVDFGLATDLTSARGETDTALKVRGTPAYLSPEQARGAAPRTASDWYAVGVMLYESLTGQLPFIGSRSDMIAARLTRTPRPPGALVEGLPQDLTQLCESLLERDPFARPNGFRLTHLLGLRPSVAATPQALEGGAFVGRDEEVARLEAAFEMSLTGRAVSVQVRGEAGVGKSTLAERFTSKLVLNGEAAVLKGRCFERDAGSYSALSELLDDLARALGSLPAVEAARLMPRDIRALTQLFPHLGNLACMKDLGGRRAPKDPIELRRRAFDALRELFDRMCDVQPLVLVVEDAHWGDHDSAELIEHILAPPSPPPIMFIAVALATGGEEDTEFLDRARIDAPGDVAGTQEDIHLTALNVEASGRLARSLLPEQLQTDARIDAIAQESQGNPLFIGELVRAQGANQGETVRLQEAIAARLARLPSHPSEALEALCLTTKGLTQPLVEQLCSLTESDAAAALNQLREQRLVVVRSPQGHPHFAVAHRAIRTAAVARLTEEARKRTHRRIAELFESRGADAATIAHQYLQANDPRSAARFSEKAGDAAQKRSALTQAITHYNDALLGAAHVDEQQIKTKLAQAMGRAGLGPRSAELHLELARDVSVAAPHLIQAGEHYLLAGLTEQALETLSPVLKRYALSPPSSKLWGAFRLLLRRWAIRRRLARLPSALPTDEDEPDISVELSWTLANGFAGVDIFLAVHYNSITLLRSLRAAKPRSTARALALDGILRILEGVEAARVGEAHVALAERIASETGDPHARGWSTGARAIAALSRGELRSCEELGREALSLLRESDQVSFREIGTLSTWFWLYPSFLLGKLDQVARQAPRLAREAEARGDRYTLSTMRTYVLPLHHLAQGQPEMARQEADRGLEIWQGDSWQNQHWAHFHAHCFIDLYEGDGHTILSRLGEAMPHIKASFQMRILAIRTDVRFLEARGLLESHRRGLNGKASLKRVHQLIQALLSEDLGLAKVYAATLRASLRALEEPSTGELAFRELSNIYEQREMILHAAAARCRGAQFVSPEAQTAADNDLRSLGARDPKRLTDCLIPQFEA